MSDLAKKLSVEIYSDRVVTTLVMFSIFWSVLGMLAGVYVAAELVWPALSFEQSWLSFGRLRTFHTNVVIFGFGVSALMGTAYYSVQRTSHVRLFAPGLAWFTCWAWQIAILFGGLSLLAGFTTSKEYAELEWPLDIAIALVWVFCNCFLWHHREATHKRNLHIKLVLWWVNNCYCDVAHC